MILYDTIGTDYRSATRIGFDWHGFIPVIDPASLLITDIVEEAAANQTGGLEFVKVLPDGTLEPGGRDAAVRVA